MRSLVPKRWNCLRSFSKTALTTLEFCLDLGIRRKRVFQNNFSSDCAMSFLVVWSLNCVQLLWPHWLYIAHQGPLSMGFPRQEYWSGFPFSSPGHIPDPGIEPGFPALLTDFFTLRQYTNVLAFGLELFIKCFYRLLCLRINFWLLEFRMDIVGLLLGRWNW